MLVKTARDPNLFRKKNDKKAYEYCKTAIERGYKTNNIILDHKNKKILIKQEKEQEDK